VSHRLLEGTNEPQRLAITHGEGPLLVLAGAGSGKTRVLTRRVAWLLEERRVPGRGILAITFTNRAAAEMKERILALVPRPDLWISTFHSACARILRREADAIGLPRDFTIYDETDRAALLRAILKEKDLDPARHRPAAVASTISRWKNAMLAPADVARGEGLDGRSLAAVFDAYERRLRDLGALDFDDLLLKAIELFEGNPELLARYRERFEHVLIDEFQDTNPPQYRIAKALAGERKNLAVVGDPDQSIYSWRGADIRNLLDFERDFPGTTIVRLEQNYRSTKRILAAADAVIRRNRFRKERGLWTENPEGGRLVLLPCRDEEDEAREVALQIRSLAASGRPLREIAVFYRTNFLQRALERGLREAAIPYRIVAGVEFFERREVRDLLAYLRVLVNPRDDLAAERVAGTPPRGIGEKSLAALAEHGRANRLSLRQTFARAGEVPGIATRVRGALGGLDSLLSSLAPAADGPAEEALDAVVRAIDYEAFLKDLESAGGAEGVDRVENVRELLAYAREVDRREPQGGLRGFLAEVSLVSDVDAFDADADRVSLLTLHSAKGLEFATVLLVGCEEGLLPHARSVDEPAALEEERRLFYVGLTRAKERVFLTYTRTRSHFGEGLTSVPSRFLAEIPSDLLEGHGSPGEDDEAAEAPPDVDGDLSGGDLVEHHQFGRGRVVAVSGRGANARAVVAFERFGEKTLLLAYARLERIGATG
jgi:DNA helicase-2/ATP-dependent DNA helicase PcrA